MKNIEIKHDHNNYYTVNFRSAEVAEVPDMELESTIGNIEGVIDVYSDTPNGRYSFRLIIGDLYSISELEAKVKEELSKLIFTRPAWATVVDSIKVAESDEITMFIVGGLASSLLMGLCLGLSRLAGM